MSEYRNEFIDWLVSEWYNYKPPVYEIVLSYKMYKEVATDPEHYLHSLLKSDQCQVDNCQYRHEIRAIK